MYNSHEEEKKKEYGPRVLQVEKATMTAAVMSTLGGIRLSNVRIYISLHCNIIYILNIFTKTKTFGRELTALDTI